MVGCHEHLISFGKKMHSTICALQVSQIKIWVRSCQVDSKEENVYNRLANEKKVCIMKLISHYVQEQTIHLIV